jgi:site-specific recombinase XerD
MDSASNIRVFPLPPAETWIVEYTQTALASRDKATVEAYTRVLKRFTSWLAEQPGSQGHFHPRNITRTAVEVFLGTLVSTSHKQQARSAISRFCQWLVEEKEVLARNPARGIQVPPQAMLAPRVLGEKERFALRQVVERAGGLRGEAIFSLGYWAGCRVSDVSHLLMEHVHVTAKAGWIHVGHKGEKWRDIDLINEARRPLSAYLTAVADDQGAHKRKQTLREPPSAYVFTSQREKLPVPEGEYDGWRLTEDGIHLWFQRIKRQATKEEWDLIHNITFHDLRHDFAHRAREAGWSLEEIAYYLGHITNKGTPAIQTTVRYTQVSREQVKEKLKDLKG